MREDEKQYREDTEYDKGIPAQPGRDPSSAVLVGSQGAGSAVPVPWADLLDRYLPPVGDLDADPV